MLLRGSEVAGLPVVTTCCGEDVAQVRSVVYEATESRFVGLTLAKRGLLHGKLKESLPADLILAIGPAAVIIDSCDHLSGRGDAPQALSSPSRAQTVVGLPALGEDGSRLGDIGDVVLQAGPGATVVGFVLTAKEPSERFIPAWLDFTVSDDAFIVPGATAAALHHDLSGFGAALEQRSGSPGGTP